MTVSRVLVTGASGFIAQHCIAELLRRGYGVRGTVRNLSRADETRTAAARAGGDGAAIEFVAADLLSDQGWDAALEGCSHVLHLASPFPSKLPRRREELIAPARDGAIRVLRAATRAGVQRVVLTSSIAAIIYPSDGPQSREYSETDWTSPERTDISAYIASKAIAEKAAWDYIATADGAPELVAINPGFVQGELLSPDVSTSHEVIRRLATGGYPAAPRAGYPMVDVADVAVAHVVAMTHPAAAGERFLATNGYMTIMEMGQAVAAALPDLAKRVPDWVAPDFIVRGMTLLDSSAKAVIPDLGVRRTCSNAKARAILGIEFGSPVEAVKASARSLRALGLI